MLFGDDRRVGNDIVDIGGAHRPRIAHIIDLDRRRLPSQNVQPVVLDESHQIDRDIDLKAPHYTGNFFIVFVPDIDKMLKRATGSSPYR